MNENQNSSIAQKIFFKKMARNNSEEINFQLIVDEMKQKKISWTFFVDLMQNLSHSDIKKLRKVNAILLME